MPFRSRRERRLWAFAAAYTLLIYSTLGLVRPLTEWLRERNLLRLLIVAGFAVAVAAVLRRVLADRPRRREWLVLGGPALGYAAILPFAIAPEEQIHLLEYGLLGGVIHAALVERAGHAPTRQGAAAGSSATGAQPGQQARGRSPWKPALAAFLLTAALGWIDEIIQGILPSRYYDLRDVAFNALAGGLAIAAMAGRAWARSPAAAAGR
jgi:hypothetical protein